jgi:surface carbohydrate biosynthesis protein
MSMPRAGAFGVKDKSMPFLYLPMEIASRELDARLLVALFAVNAGFEVVMGQKWLLQKNAGRMPKGTWIFKTLTPGDAERMQFVSRFGHSITAIDEEMPGLGEGATKLRWVDKRCVDLCEKIFCLGQKHVDVMLQKFPEAHDKLVMTGNPRWDFLRPELRGVYAADAAALKAIHGRFILVNTNIGLVNSAKNTSEALVKSLDSDGRLNLRDEVDRQWVEDLLAFERSNFAAAVPLMKRLQQQFPSHKIILRPHPTEKIEPYEEQLKGVERVAVLREGPAAAWISASDVLVHTSCTTANEAFALGKPAICFETLASPLHRYFLSGQLSLVARDEDEVIDHVRSVLAGNVRATAVQSDTFHRFFAAQSGAFASERIALAVSGAQHAIPLESQWKAGIFFRRKWWPTKFQRRMFPDFTQSELNQRLSELAGALGRKSPAMIHRLGDGLYHVRPVGMSLSKATTRQYLPV